ncbi:MAG TPA: hypothetical protein VLE95_00085 [Chlamydiales bacterium]|nr:hypothetical protein [Chlamydiales bacterium]
MNTFPVPSAMPSYKEQEGDVQSSTSCYKRDVLSVSRRFFLGVQAYPVFRFSSDSSTDSSTTAFKRKRIEDEERPDMQSSASSSDTPQDPEIDRSDARAQEGAPRAKRRKIERRCDACHKLKTNVNWYEIGKGSGRYECNTCHDTRLSQNQERKCVVCPRTTSIKWYEIEKGSGRYKCRACYEKNRRQNHPPREKTERWCVVCKKKKFVVVWHEIEEGYKCHTCHDRQLKGKIETVS